MTEEQLTAFLEAFKQELIELFEQHLLKSQKQLLTTKEAANYLGVSYNTFQKLRYEGIKMFEVDGIKRVYKADLDTFIQTNSRKIGGK